MSGPDFTGWSTEKLVATYWSMPINNGDDDAFNNAICDELSRRRVGLAESLGPMGLGE